MKEVIVELSQKEEPEGRKLFESRFTVETDRGAGWSEDEVSYSKQTEKRYTFLLAENQRLIVDAYLPKAVGYSREQGAAYPIGAQEGLKIDEPIEGPAYKSKDPIAREKAAAEKAQWLKANPGKEYVEPGQEEEDRKKLEEERRLWDEKQEEEAQKAKREGRKFEKEPFPGDKAKPKEGGVPGPFPSKTPEPPKAGPKAEGPKPDPNPGLISSKEVKAEDKKK